MSDDKAGIKPGPMRIFGRCSEMSALLQARSGFDSSTVDDWVQALKKPSGSQRPYLAAAGEAQRNRPLIPVPVSGCRRQISMNQSHGSMIHSETDA